jgi:AcrR family transcriptional regulator
MKKSSSRSSQASLRRAIAPPLLSYRKTGGSTTLRKLTRAGYDTRTKLLDAAELLFAKYGYEGTALRDVSDVVDLNHALSTYHFGKKQRLFDEVVARRTIVIHESRMAVLAGIAPNLPRAATIRELIRGYVSPLIAARYGTDPQWTAYVQISIDLLNYRHYSHAMKRNIDLSAGAYLDKFQELLPHAGRDLVIDAFRFMVGAMVLVCSKSDQLTRGRKPYSRRKEMIAVTDHLVEFVYAGFAALEKQPAKR